jgi:hypothetical protein
VSTAILSGFIANVSAPGLRVHVSDASPRGFSGHVTAVHPGALTVARDDNGAWELVILSRRRVMAVESVGAQWVA